jgi:hypothetical protein
LRRKRYSADSCRKKEQAEMKALAAKGTFGLSHDTSNCPSAEMNGGYELTWPAGQKGPMGGAGLKK